MWCRYYKLRYHEFHENLRRDENSSSKNQIEFPFSNGTVRQPVGEGDIEMNIIDPLGDETNVIVDNSFNE
jgi:hypothetical protein